MQFKQNRSGGVDVLEGDKLLVHLSDEDFSQLFELYQKKQDMNMVKRNALEWIERWNWPDLDYWSDFNSQVFSDDEVAFEDVFQKIIDNVDLVDRIAVKYRANLDGRGLSGFDALKNAFDENVSIKGILGDILFEKHPQEFCIGKWRLAVVQQGETYGHNGAVVHEDVKPVVEFYDMSQDKERFPNGQFTGGRYYLETLLSSDIWSESIDKMAERGVGLCLHGDVASWTVPAGELAVIAAWLRAVQDKLGPAKEVETLDTTLAEASDRCRQGPADAEQSRDKDELTLD